MKVKVEGATIALGKNEFIAQGGEGSVYVRGSHAYKIYTDPSRMIPLDKISELSAIQDSNVIKPERVIKDNRGTSIGYTMRYVDGTHPLCQIFTKSFRTRHGIEDQAVLDLIQGMRDTVGRIHVAKILVVDMNELNFLVDGTFENVFFIDVDSYQTPHFKATALMASVQDPKTPIGDFNEASDWFSWGCVTFQMLMGIHPYKGKYKAVKGLTQRMEAGISVFHPDVTMPKVCPPLDSIPQDLRGWFEAVFQGGKRVAPPSCIDTAPMASVGSVPIMSMSDALDTVLVLSVGEKILSVHVNGSNTVVRTTNNLAFYMHKQLLKQHKISKGTIAVHWNQLGAPFAFKLQGRRCNVLALTSGDREEILPPVDQLMEHEGRVYLKSGDKVLEVRTTGMYNHRMATQVVANVVPNASKLYPGCCIQNMLGSIFVNLFSAPGLSHQVRVPELDNMRILDAKLDGTVLMVVTYDGDSDTYINMVFWFSDDFRTYSVRNAGLGGNWGINFVHMDSGVNVCLTEQEELSVFSTAASGFGRRVQDDVLSSDMHLFKRPGGKLMFFRGEEIYSIQMR